MLAMAHGLPLFLAPVGSRGKSDLASAQWALCAFYIYIFIYTPLSLLRHGEHRRLVLSRVRPWLWVLRGPARRFLFVTYQIYFWASLFRQFLCIDTPLAWARSSFQSLQNDLLTGLLRPGSESMRSCCHGGFPACHERISAL